MGSKYSFENGNHNPVSEKKFGVIDVPASRGVAYKPITRNFKSFVLDISGVGNFFFNFGSILAKKKTRDKIGSSPSNPIPFLEH